MPPRPEAVALLPGAKSDEHEMGVVKGGKLTAVDSQASQSKETDLYSAVTHPTVLNIIFIYFVHSFVGVISHEIIPMWVVNKKEDHGFEMNTSEIGGILTLVAPFQVAFQGFAYPVLAARWKYIKVHYPYTPYTSANHRYNYVFSSLPALPAFACTATWFIVLTLTFPFLPYLPFLPIYSSYLKCVSSSMASL